MHTLAWGVLFATAAGTVFSACSAADPARSVPDDSGLTGHADASQGASGSGGAGGGAGAGGSRPTTGGTGGAAGSGGAGGAGGSRSDASVSDAAADHASSIDAGPPCTTCQLHVQYKAADTNASDNQIKPHFNVVNVGTTSVPLSQLVIRYWYSSDGNRPEVYYCDYAKIQCSNVTGKFVKLTTPRGGADSYLEVGFTSGAGSLGGGTDTGEIQNRFNKDDYSTYNQSNDYSFDPSKTDFTDWMRVTLYDNGGLEWGTEPGCPDTSGGAQCTPSDGGTPADSAVDGASGDVGSQMDDASDATGM